MFSNFCSKLWPVTTLPLLVTHGHQLLVCLVWLLQQKHEASMTMSTTQAPSLVVCMARLGYGPFFDVWHGFVSHELEMG